MPIIDPPTHAFLSLDNRSDGLVNGRATKHVPVPQKSLPDLPPPRAVSDSSMEAWTIILNNLAYFLQRFQPVYVWGDTSRLSERRPSAWEALGTPNQIPTSDLVNSMLVLSFTVKEPFLISL